jgi:hypothetical protein
MFDPGNVNVAAPYRISGRSGVLGVIAAAGAVARLVQFGMSDPRTPGAIVPTPIRVSQIRLKYAPQTGGSPTGGATFEVLKGTSTAQATGGTGTDATNLHVPQRRKTTGYPAILATETSLFVAATAVITGGNFTPLDASGPIDWVSVGLADVSSGASVWTPSDLCGETLEAGEALEVRASVASTGTGILLVAFDFLR